MMINTVYNYSIEGYKLFKQSVENLKCRMEFQQA